MDAAAARRRRRRFATDVLPEYSRCQLQSTRWLLVEARDRIMAEVHTRLAGYTTRELRARGVEVLTETTVGHVQPDRIHLSTGDTVPTRSLVWTTGVRPHPVVGQFGLPLRDGRVAVDRSCRVEGRANVWAIGDAAAVPDPAHRDRPCPPTAQHAVRQGQTVARNVAPALGGTGRARPYRYRTLGLFVDLGRRRAVAARLPGLVPGPQLPRCDHAGTQATGTAHHRLDHRLGLRTRHLRARSTRASPGAERPDAERAERRRQPRTRRRKL